MDSLNQISASTAVLANLSSFFPALAARTAALVMVVWMTRQIPTSLERKLAIGAWALLLASKVIAAIFACATTWVFASNHALMYDKRALLASHVLGTLLSQLLEPACLLILAWVMVRVLRKS